MRTDQHFGLTEAANLFLAENEKKPGCCPHCNHPYDAVLTVIGRYYGMFQNEYSLFRHELKDGGHANEYLQADPWSSGPCFFLGLEIFNKDGKICNHFKWSQEEIDNC